MCLFDTLINDLFHPSEVSSLCLTPSHILALWLGIGDEVDGGLHWHVRNCCFTCDLLFLVTFLVWGEAWREVKGILDGVFFCVESVYL